MEAVLSELRVLIAHDWLVAWAGAERCVEQILHVLPQADLVAGVLSPRMRAYNEVTLRAKETWLGRVPGARTSHRWFLPLEGLAFATLDTRAYDVVISSSHALSKMVHRGKHALHVCYCHSPPRYLWDLHDAYRRDATWLQRLALRAGTTILRRLDTSSAQRVDHFMSNSQCVASRIRRWYGRDADVVNPPVATKGHLGVEHRRGEFLLSLGRLVPYKRVDLAVAAAERLGIKLVVAGDGPDLPRLRALAGRHTEFAGEVTETEAAELLSTCQAFVFCAEEDFGIAPVEANAHGAPVVGYAAGGLLETMVADVTAEFFQDQTVVALCGAVTRALARDWDPIALRRNAGRFAPERFREAFGASLLKALALRSDRR